MFSISYFHLHMCAFFYCRSNDHGDRALTFLREWEEIDLLVFNVRGEVIKLVCSFALFVRSCFAAHQPSHTRCSDNGTSRLSIIIMSAIFVPGNVPAVYPLFPE